MGIIVLWMRIDGDGEKLWFGCVYGMDLVFCCTCALGMGGILAL